MSRLRVSLLLLPALLLSGCSLFYPNWGATSLPEDDLIPSSDSPASTDSAQPTESPSASSTATSTASPSPSTSESVMRTEVGVEIVMAVVEADLGLLTVIAQVPGVTDATGICSLTFLADSFEKTYSVSAEQSSDFMQCAPFEVSLDDLPSGSGLVTVNFESTRFFGKSGASSAVIP